MLPVPVNGKPIAVLVLLQLKVVPAPVLAPNGKLIASPGQTTTLVTALGMGSGLTVIVKVSAGPAQRFLVALTVMVTVTGAAVALVAVKPGIAKGDVLSEPSANPIAAPPLQV